MAHTGRPNLIKQLNRSAILELLREKGPMSRARIARVLRLSPATVTRIVSTLVEENLVLKVGTADSTGGRRPTLLQFNYAANAIVGIDMGGTHIVGALADLGGNILQKASLPSFSADGQGDSLKQLIKVIDQLLSSPRLENQELKGIGIGAPSITLHQEGVVVWAASLGWRNLPLRRIIEGRFHVPVFVENDVSLAALGESWYGVGKGVHNLVCISIGTGIGAGIVIDGKLYRGSGEAAGEVGYLVPDSSYLGKRYEQFGCIETLSAGPGIVRRALAAVERDRDTLLRELAGGDLKALTAEKVFEAARRGDALAQQVVDETVDHISLIVASVAAILNPELIVLGGGIARSDDLLMEPIRQRVQGVVPVMPLIKASELGENAAVMGAIAMVLHSTSDIYLDSEA